MGNNQAYTFMEATVVGAYNLGVLDKKLLTVLLEPYRGTDIDHGGMTGLKSKDGLEADDIIIRVMDPKTFIKLEALRLEMRKFPKKYEKMTQKQQDFQEQYYEKRYDAVHKITYKQFGWR